MPAAVTDRFDPLEYARRGLRRAADYAPPATAAQAAAEAARAPVPVATGPAAVDDGNQFERGLRRGAYDLAAAVPVLVGAGRNLVDAGSGDASVDTGVGLLRRGEELGPSVTALNQIHDIGSALDYAAGQAGSLVPSLALTLAGGGVGGAAAKGVARRAALGAAERYAARKAAESGAGAVAEGAVARVAPRFAAAADAASAPAVAAGRAAGSIAGQYPSVIATSAEGAPDAQGNLVGGLKGASAGDTAKILLGDLGASALGALPEFRLLQRAGGAAAADVIARNTQRILPRVAKEAAKQGALGGGLGVAQTAAQFAAHKWVNDNVDLMSPGAFQSYLDSMVAGAALGAGLGGAVEGGAALSARVRGDGTPNPQWAALKQKVRDNLSRAGQASEAAFTKARGTYDAFFRKAEGEGQPVQPGGAAAEAPAAGEAPAQGAEAPADAAAPRTATEAAQEIGAKIGEGAAKLHQGALDMFERLARNLSTEEGRSATTGAFGDAVDTLKERFNIAPLQAGIEAVMKSYSDALQRAKTPEAQADVQKAYGKVLEEHVTDVAPDTATSFDENLRLLQDDAQLDDRAQSAIDRISQRFESGEADALVPNQRSPKQNPVDLGTPLQRQLGAAIPTDAPIWAFPEAVKPLMASAEKLFTGAEMSARDHANLDILRRYAPDKVDEWEAAGPRYHELTQSANEAHTAVDAEEATQSRADALRKQIFRDGGADGGALVENRSGGGAAFWRTKDPRTNANTIGIGTREVRLSNGNTVKRQEALQLDNLISKKLAEDPGIGPKAALLSVLGDLEEAGIHVQPETITPGVVYKSAAGEAFTLSPREAAAIRASYEGSDRRAGLSERAQRVSANRQQRADAMRQARAAKAAAENETTVNELAAAKRKPAEDVRIDTRDDSPDSRIPGPERVPREAPPQGATGRGSEQTSTLSNVGDVKLKPSPYEGLLTRARRLRESASTPRERGKIVHDTGVTIGRAELAKERDAGTISGRRFAAEMKRLDDPASGLSRKYFENARDGKYDRGEHRPTAAEDASPTDARGAASEAVRKAGVEALGNKYAKNADIAERIAQAQRAKNAGEPLSPVDAKLLRIARNAADALPEDHPFRVAVEDAQTESRVADRERQDREAARAAREKHDAERLQDTVDEGVKETTKAEGAHDTAKETEALNAVLDRLGIKERVKVVAHEDARKRGGDYHPGRGEIRIGASLRGAERMEVLAHELGHHILRSELAKAMGVKTIDIAGKRHADIFDLMAQHNPELHAAIDADYQKWAASHGLDTRYGEALASRKPVHRAESLRAITEGDGRTLRYVLQAEPENFGYVLSFEEYVADQISRALTHTDTSPVAKFFKGIADKLKLAYETLFGGKGGKEYAPAPSVEKWVQSLFDRTTQDVSSALGKPVSAEQARTATQAALHAALSKLPPGGAGEPPKPPGGAGASPQLPPEGMKALVKFIRNTLPKDSRQVLDTVLARGRAVQVLERLYKDQPGALKAMRDPKHALEAKIAYAYLAWRDGKFRVGREGQSALRGIGDDLMNIVRLAGNGTFAERVFNDIENGRIAEMVKRGQTYDVRAREAAYRGKAQAIANEVQRAYMAVRAPFAKAFVASIERMRQTGVPAIRRAGALLQRHSGEAGDDPGMLPATTHVTDRFMRAAGAAFEGLNDREILHALTALQRQDGAHFNPKVAASVQKVRALFDQFHAYAREAGIDVPKRKDYFPVVLDIRDAAQQKTLRELLSQPKFEAAIRKALNEPTEPIGELIERMVSQQRESDPTSGPQEFSAKNYRLMQFIYALGNDADKKTFASLQSKSPADIFARYVQPMVREAEFVRRFGPDGAKLERLVLDARAQGASNDDIAQLRAAVDGARGRVGIDGSPTIRALFGARAAEKVSTRGFRRAVSYGQAYQNARLLPLAVLSSLVDPMGIAVRTGGDFKTAWDGFKLGIKSLTDKSTRAELQGMLRALGSADDFLASDILSSNFGRGEGGARKVNDFIFHANGLASWTRTTRFMALQAAHKFLLKHADGGNTTSKRYLDELGVRPGDIKPNADGRVSILTNDERAAATPAARAADDRVRNALLRFVDESVLRPTSQQAPNWFADPYVGLVTQYKHFAYAIYDQIGKRILNEFRHGNSRVLLPAMSYLPVIIATEMIRGVLQYGPGGNPNRDNWGPEEYTTYALDRSGLLGPKLAFNMDAIGDVQHGNLPGTSYLGPTVQQAQEVVRTAAGRGSIGRTLENALPAEALFKHWNDGA